MDLLEVTLDKGVAIGGEDIAEREGLIDSPRLLARVDEVRVERELTTFNAAAVGLDDSRGYRAADGHEFVLVSVLRQRFSGEVDTDDGPDSVVVRAGDANKAVDLDGWQAGPSGFAVVASVPVGDPVWLEVADSGRTVRYDLRHQEYAADSTWAEFYGGDTRIAAGYVPEASAASPLDGERSARYTLSAYTAQKDLHHPRLGPGPRAGPGSPRSARSR